MGFLNSIKNIFGGKNQKKRRIIDDLQIEISHLSPIDANNHKFMEMTTFLKIADYFDKVKSIKFLGWGEPLAHPQALEMIKIAKEKSGRPVEIFTDGKLLTPPISQELINLNIDKITINLFHPDKPLNEITENLRNLLIIRKNEPKITIDYKMSTQNLNKLHQVMEMAGNLGVDEFSTSHIDFIFNEELNNLKVFEGLVSDDNRGDLIKQGQAKGKAEYEEILMQAEKVAKQINIYFDPKSLVPKEAVVCEYNPFKNPFITWEGFLAPCPFLALKNLPPYYFNEEKQEQNPFIIGDLRSKTIPELWNDLDYQEFRTFFDKRLHVFNKYMEETFEDEPTAKLIYDNYEKLDRQLLENKMPLVCRKCYKGYSI